MLKCSPLAGVDKRSIRLELCPLIKLEQVGGGSPSLSCWVSQPLPRFNWKDSYWQCLITIQWTQSRYEGSLESGMKSEPSLAVSVRWCDCKIRRVHVSNNGIPSHYLDDTDWQGSMMNSCDIQSKVTWCVFKYHNLAVHWRSPVWNLIFDILSWTTEG